LPLAALLVAGVAAGVLALIHPIWAVYMAILAVPVQEIVVLPGGLNFVQAALLLALGSWGLRALSRPDQPILFGRLFPGLALLLFALSLATILTPYSFTEAVKETVRWASAALMYLLALNMCRPDGPDAAGWRWRAGGLVACLLAAPTANGLLGLWQFFTADAPPSFLIAGGRFARAYGTIGQPNSFAGSLNMAWPLAVALCLVLILDFRFWIVARSSKIQNLKSKIVLLASVSLCAAVLLAALVATFSRGGWVGAAGGAAAMLLAVGLLLPAALRRRFTQGLALAVGAAGVVLLLGGGGLLPDALEQRISSITRNLRLFDVRTVAVTPENFAVVERMAQLQAAWHMFTSHPLTGVGPGNYTLAYEGRGPNGSVPPMYVHPWYQSRGHAHNYYVHTAAEVGIIGLFAYLVLAALQLVQARATLLAAPANDWFARGVAVGGCGIILAVLTHNFFENLHVLNLGVQLGAVWGLLAALERCESQP
ncbi:MAG: O-antigen ligase family protein, partial [Chloroflexaceae bacterium]|nr:O-antigen ligase family protein [Chloroflexaceae bacterium]